MTWSGAKHLAAKGAPVIKEADRTKRAVRRLHRLAHGKALKASTTKSAQLGEADAYAQTVELQELVDETEIVLRLRPERGAVG